MNYYLLLPSFLALSNFTQFPAQHKRISLYMLPFQPSRNLNINSTSTIKKIPRRVLYFFNDRRSRAVFYRIVDDGHHFRANHKICHFYTASYSLLKYEYVVQTTGLHSTHTHKLGLVTTAPLILSPRALIVSQIKIYGELLPRTANESLMSVVVQHGIRLRVHLYRVIHKWRWLLKSGE